MQIQPRKLKKIIIISAATAAEDFTYIAGAWPFARLQELLQALRDYLTVCYTSKHSGPPAVGLKGHRANRLSAAPVTIL